MIGVQSQESSIYSAATELKMKMQYIEIYSGGSESSAQLEVVTSIAESDQISLVQMDGAANHPPGC